MKSRYIASGRSRLVSDHVISCQAVSEYIIDSRFMSDEKVLFYRIVTVPRFHRTGSPPLSAVSNASLPLCRVVGSPAG